MTPAEQAREEVEAWVSYVNRHSWMRYLCTDDLIARLASSYERAVRAEAKLAEYEQSDPYLISVKLKRAEAGVARLREAGRMVVASYERNGLRDTLCAPISFLMSALAATEPNIP